MICLLLTGCRDPEEKPPFEYDKAGVVEDRMSAPPPPETVFRNLDRNGDGQVDREEVTAIHASPKSREQAAEIFSLCDHNRDGKLTLEEFGFSSPRVAHLRRDQDGNGVLSFDEYTEGVMPQASRRQAQEFFRLVDRNGDGAVDFDESQKRPVESGFLLLDENEDGRLSLAEFAAEYWDMVYDGRCEKLFALLDDNHDQALGREEHVDRPEEVTFILRDANADDKLTLEEFAPGATRAGRAAAGEQFAKRDRDGDGHLSLREFLFRAGDEAFWAMDRDANERVSLEEFVAGESGQAVSGAGLAARNGALQDDAPRSGAMQGAIRVFGAMDLDGNRGLSLEEFRIRRVRDPEQVKDELVLHYDFSEVRQGWVDDVSGHGHHAQLRNAQVIEDRQSAARAVKLEGTGSLVVPRVPEELDPSFRPLWLAAWCLPAASEGVVIGMGNHQHGFALYLQGGLPHFATRSDGHLSQAVAPDPVPLSRWVHLAGGVDAKGRVWLYVNGRRVAESPGKLLTRNLSPRVPLGVDTDGPVGEYATPLHWQGLLADIRLYWGCPAAGEPLPLDTSTAPPIARDAPPIAIQAARPPVTFAGLDRDSSGALSVEEYLAQYTTEADVQLGRELFAILDADGDASVAAAEYEAGSFRALYRRRDKDGNGVLSFDEYIQAVMPQAARRRAEEFFRLVDRNGDGAVDFEESRVRPVESDLPFRDEDEDGKLSLAEFSKDHAALVKDGRCEALFRAYDRDGNGGLSLDELVNRSAKATFLLRDKDGDGRLTRDEFAPGVAPVDRAAAQEQFGKRDEDGDGALSLEEFAGGEK